MTKKYPIPSSLEGSSQKKFITVGCTARRQRFIDETENDLRLLHLLNYVA
jgi:hypothetical protein